MLRILWLAPGPIKPPKSQRLPDFITIDEARRIFDATRVLSYRVFRAKMLAAMVAAGLSLPARHPAQWVVDCKSVGRGAKALINLGRYLYRGVISENDIVASADGLVSFRYRAGKAGKTECRTVPGEQFLWLVL